MNKHEKIVLTNGSTYDLIINGIINTKETLSLSLYENGFSLTDIDAEFDKPENVNVINVLSKEDEIIDIKKGFKYLSSCQKLKNQVVGRNLIKEAEIDDKGTIIAEAEYEDVFANVIKIVLNVGDLRAELDAANEKIAELNDTVDMLVLTALE